jgi:integrase
VALWPPPHACRASRSGCAQRSDARRRILGPAVKQANEDRAKAGLPPITGTTNHSLRRTFASLLYEADASPAYVMSQLGHTSSALALEVYARKMTRERDTGARMDALNQGADWAETGRKDDFTVEAPRDVAPA